jgi:Rieske Fe-S protein
MDKETIINRRSFIKRTGLLLGGSLSLPVLASFVSSCERTETPVNNTNTIEHQIGDTPPLLNIGGIARVGFGDANGGYPIIIIRISQSEFLTFSSKCTHQGCIVEVPAAVSEPMNCQCHGSSFSSDDGTVLNGPSDGETIAKLPKLNNSFDEATNILRIFT